MFVGLIHDFQYLQGLVHQIVWLVLLQVIVAMQTPRYGDGFDSVVYGSFYVSDFISDVVEIILLQLVFADLFAQVTVFVQDAFGSLCPGKAIYLIFGQEGCQILVCI